MDSILRDGLVSLREHFRVRVTDWLLSAILFSWGFSLFWTRPEVWSLPTFSGLAQLADQYVWATACTIVGLIRLAALFVNGTMQRSPHARAICAFLSCFVWFQLTLALILADWRGPGIGIFPWFLMADAFNANRAAGDARASDRRAEQARRNSAALGAQRA